jgi:hypothetical protein
VKLVVAEVFGALGRLDDLILMGGVHRELRPRDVVDRRPSAQPPGNFSTRPPKACATIWWPKQMPTSGRPASRMSRMKASSGAIHGRSS